MKCLECGHDLEIMRQELIGFVPNDDYKGYFSAWKYSNTEYAGHCKNCLNDWQWNEIYDNGGFFIYDHKRIFWG